MGLAEYYRIVFGTIAVGPLALQNPYRLACLACSQAPFPLYKGSLRSLAVSVISESERVSVLSVSSSEQ